MYVCVYILYVYITCMYSTRRLENYPGWRDPRGPDAPAGAAARDIHSNNNNNDNSYLSLSLSLSFSLSLYIYIYICIILNYIGYHITVRIT